MYMYLHVYKCFFIWQEKAKVAMQGVCQEVVAELVSAVCTIPDIHVMFTCTYMYCHCTCTSNYSV